MKSHERQLAPNRLTSSAKARQHDPDIPPITVRPQMSPYTPEPNEKRHWESVHKCSRCGYELNLEKLDLNETTTGIAACPRCEWSGQIDLQIVPGQRLDE